MTTLRGHASTAAWLWSAFCVKVLCGHCAFIIVWGWKPSQVHEFVHWCPAGGTTNFEKQSLIGGRGAQALSQAIIFPILKYFGKVLVVVIVTLEADHQALLPTLSWLPDPPRNEQAAAHFRCHSTSSSFHSSPLQLLLGYSISAVREGRQTALFLYTAIHRQCEFEPSVPLRPKVTSNTEEQMEEHPLGSS